MQSINDKNYSSHVSVGQRVQAWYAPDNRFYEAVVVSTSSRYVLVSFLGYGNTESLEPGKVRQTPSLPLGWEEHTDPSSGFLFWTHSITGESQWERPEGTTSSWPAKKVPPSHSTTSTKVPPSHSTMSTKVSPSHSTTSTIPRRTREDTSNRDIFQTSATSSLRSAGSGIIRETNGNSYNRGTEESAASRIVREAAMAPGAFSMSANATRAMNVVTPSSMSVSAASFSGRSQADSVPGAFGRRPMRRRQMAVYAGGCGCGVAGC